MNCRQLEKWVAERGAGNLPAPGLEHLASCSSCRKSIDDIRLIDRSVANTTIPDPGELYWQSFSLRVGRSLDRPVSIIASSPAVPAWRLVLERLWAPVAAIALLVVVANQNLQVAPQPQESTKIVSQNEFSLRDEQYPSEYGSVPVIPQIEKPSVATSVPDNSTDKRSRSTEQQLHTERNARVGAGEASAGASAKVEIPVEPTLAENAASEQVWPDRQIIIMGEVDSSEPAQQVGSDKILANQNSYGEYERQLAQSSQDIESTLTPAGPGRLLGAPAPPLAGGVDSQSPAEAMRRFDEVAELRELIARVETIAPSKRVNSQWTQWSTAWFRLGMLTNSRSELELAISAVMRYQAERQIDATDKTEWLSRQTQLENRRSSLP